MYCVHSRKICVQKHFKNLKVEQTNNNSNWFYRVHGSWGSLFPLRFVIWICL